MKTNELIKELKSLIGKDVWHRRERYHVYDVRFLETEERKIDPSDDVLIQTQPEGAHGFTMCAAEVERVDYNENETECYVIMQRGTVHLFIVEGL